MPRYIPITTFKKLYKDESSLLTREGLEEFLSSLKVEGDIIARENGFSQDDYAYFSDSISSPENILFYNWTAKSASLEGVLLSGKLIPFQDEAGVQKHQLYAKYKKFISPCLADSILCISISEIGERVNAFSYVKLLDDDHNTMVEQVLLKPIQKELNEAYDYLRRTEEEQLLIDKVTPLCSDDIIACVNSLSRSMYSARLGYVDDVLRFIRTKPCTARFANWLLKRMEMVQLNAEHENRISDWKQELREGKIKVRNDGVKGRSPIRWKPLISGLLIIGLVGLVFYIVKYEPFSEVQLPDENKNTSFKQFTFEERKKIDSLLKEMEGLDRSDDFIDYASPIIGGSATITFRKEFTATKMEQVFEDLDKDAHLQSKGFVDSCSKSIDYEPISGVDDLISRTGNLKAGFRNESDYDLIIFVSEGTRQGKVYSTIIKKDKTMVLQLNHSDEVIIVPGLKYNKYVAPNVSAPELPSSDFTHHFCEVDFNYRESINAPYRIVMKGLDKAKFLINGNKGDYLQVVDIYGVLETM